MSRLRDTLVRSGCALAALALAIPPARAQVAKLIELRGKDDGDRYGRAAFVGDVNRDGFGDFAVGAYFEDNANGVEAGAAYVYSGRDASVLASWMGDGPGDTFGAIVKNVGDQDGDGFDDLAASATSDFASGLPNYVRVFSGRFLFDGGGAAVIRTITADLIGDFGSDVDGAGDVDGDGFADLLVGTTGRQPGVTIYSGQTGAELWSLADASGTGFGMSVSRFTDFDGDGFPDVLIGDFTHNEPGVRDAGVVHVYSGGPPSGIGRLLGSVAGVSADDNLGMEIELAGDLDGDGVVDFAAGAPGKPDRGTSPGYVRFYSGATLAVLGDVCGQDDGEFFGTEITVADFDGDASAEIFVAARHADVAGNGNAGRVYAFSSADGSLLFVLEGSRPGDKVGRLASGDVNADGIADLLLATGHTNQGAKKDVGTAWVLASPALLASSRHYGDGLDGKLGPPAIDVTSEAVLGASAAIEISNSRGEATFGVLLVGTAEADVATDRGGSLLVDVAWLVPLPFPDAAPLGASAAIPLDTSLAGASVFLQALELDPFAVAGISFSDGVEIVVGGSGW